MGKEFPVSCALCPEARFSNRFMSVLGIVCERGCLPWSGGHDEPPGTLLAVQVKLAPVNVVQIILHHSRLS